MNAATYHLRSLRHFWRANLAVVLGVVVASATLTGALLVGDSLRGSLRETAVERLGPFDDALLATRFFREQLAADIAADSHSKASIAQLCPLIWMPGGARNAASGARVNRVNVLGADERFWAADANEGAAASGGSQATPSDFIAATSPVADAATSASAANDQTVIVNQSLADDLGVRAGDDVLIILHKPSDVPTETLLGRPEQSSLSIRATVRAVIASRGLGNLELRPRQDAPRNAYLPLASLQRRLGQRSRANAMLAVAAQHAAPRSASAPAPAAAALGSTADLLKRHATLDDYGLRLRRDPILGCLSVESRSLLLERFAAEAVIETARSLGKPATPILTYLANSIERLGPDAATRPGNGDASVVRAIPYSTVAAIADGQDRSTVHLVLDHGDAAPPLGDDGLLLNRWAADDLGARLGDRIRLLFYESRTFGRTQTGSATFTLRGVVPMDAAGGDAGLTPEFEGITNARSLADWDAPFPMDMKLVRDQDEAYWRRYRAAPKAFVSLAAGQRLWTQRDARFGELTSIRVGMSAAAAASGSVAPASVPADAGSAASTQARMTTPDRASTEARTTERDARASDDDTARNFERALLQRLDPASGGLRFEPVRAQALAAGGGSTDFGGLFVGFSFFLIAAATMLIALLLRLNLERRAAEIGLLSAVGLAPNRIGRMMMAQGMLLSVIGAAIGLPAAAGYAWLMLAGLRSWWSAAARAPFLRLHVEPASMAIGFLAGLAVAAFSVWRAVRGLSRMPPRGLLAGQTADDAAAGARAATAAHADAASKGRPGSASAKDRQLRPANWIAGIGTVAGLASAAAAALLASGPQAALFFVAGALLLTAALAGLAGWLRRSGTLPLRPDRGDAVAAFAVRNAARRRGRSVLTAGLIASATFVIVAVGANRHRADDNALLRDGGAGGFSLMAESVVPLQYDLNAPAGRDALNLSPAARHALKDSAVYSFRLRTGDDASCLNLYQINKPRILGAPPDVLKRGGFSFASSAAADAAERDNPWALLGKPLPDGAIPAIGDANSVQWLLHLGLGDDLAVTDDQGVERRLRIVGMLSGSVLQGELVIAADAFARLFPSISGYAFFLIETPAASASAVATALEHDLGDFSFDAESTVDRLNAFLAVENTYLSTFQTLGGLGLALGTLGLAAVMLRNVWERRGELALLRAVGLPNRMLARMVLYENGLLLAAGIAAGAFAALIAVAPNALHHPRDVPWGSLGWTLLGVAAVGMSAGLMAVRSALRAPLLGALRAERL